MRIFSSFYDYYDYLAREELDPKAFVWNRDIEEYDLTKDPNYDSVVEACKNLPSPFGFEIEGVPIDHVYCARILVVGHKALPIWGVVRHYRKGNSIRKYKEWAVSIEEIVSKPRFGCRSHDADKNGWNIEESSKYRWWMHYSFSESGLNAWKKDYAQRTLWGDISKMLNTPLWCATYDFEQHSLKVIKNPNIQSERLTRIMAPYYLYQELDMFCTNRLISKSPEPRPISDEIRRDLHGFDDKSFKHRKDEE